MIFFLILWDTSRNLDKQYIVSCRYLAISNQIQSYKYVLLHLHNLFLT